MHKNKLKWVAVIVIVTVFIAVQIAADLKYFEWSSGDTILNNYSVFRE